VAQAAGLVFGWDKLRHQRHTPAVPSPAIGIPTTWATS
jgi:hypothetical protein